MQMPSFKEKQVLADALAVAAAKRKELLVKNREAARALLSSLQSPTVTTVVHLPKKDYES